MIELDEEAYYVGTARNDDPGGRYCGNCGATNYNADDCGWFYVLSIALCNKCYKASGHRTAER